MYLWVNAALRLNVYVLPWACPWPSQAEMGTSSWAPSLCLLYHGLLHTLICLHACLSCWVSTSLTAEAVFCLSVYPWCPAPCLGLKGSSINIWCKKKKQKNPQKPKPWDAYPVIFLEHFSLSPSLSISLSANIKWFTYKVICRISNSAEIDQGGR